jgi:serine/threonine protein kinase
MYQGLHEPDENTSDLGPIRIPKKDTAAATQVSIPQLTQGVSFLDPDPTVNVYRSTVGPDDQVENDRDNSQAGEAGELTIPVAMRSAPPTVHSVASDGDVLQVVKPSPKKSELTIATGDIIAGRYVVVDILPGSGMGHIYKALDPHRKLADFSSPYVALKFARHSGANLANGISRLRQEFMKLSQLHHPTIVAAFDLDVHNAVEFMVMEWLEGQSLLQMLSASADGRLSMALALEIIRQTAIGLAHCHERGIVHGDIKPSNIFITQSHCVKLLDFGASTEDDISSQNWATRAYASAEVLGGARARTSDDVYSLGITAYLMLSGKRPFGTRNAVEAQHACLRPQPLSLDAYHSWSALARALSFNPDDRTTDAAQFLAEFVQAHHQRVTGPSLFSHRLTRYALAASVVVIAVAFWSFRYHDESSGQVLALLRQAEDALSDGQLIEPKDENALYYFRNVLSESPDNPQALSGLQRITEEYLTRVRKSLAAGNLEAAQTSLSLARQVQPEHAGIPVISDLFDRHVTDLIISAGQIADKEPIEADAMLRRAEQLTTTENERIATVREKMADLAIDRDIGVLLAGIDERILGERLAVPRGDSAVDLLDKARKMRPDDDRVMLAANRILTAVLFQALFAISNDNLQEAEAYVSVAKSLHVRHLALARVEFELAKARDRLVQTNDTVVVETEPVAETH